MSPFVQVTFCVVHVFMWHTPAVGVTTLAIVFTHGLLVLLTGTVASFSIEKEHHNMI